MASLSQEIEVYISRPCEDWRDHQRILPWGTERPNACQVADVAGVDVSTAYRWFKAIAPLPVEAAFRLARTYGTQYLSYLASKNHLPVEIIRPITLKGPLMDTFAELQQEHGQVLPLLAKVDRGETLSLDEQQQVHRWRTRTVELSTAIATAALTKGSARD